MRFIRHNIVYIGFAVSILVVLMYLMGSEKYGVTSKDKAVVINEVCTNNLASLADDRGEHPDWIELYNKSSEDIDISGWKLSDSEKKRSKWEFPEGTSISANGFLLVYADGTRQREIDIDKSFSLESLIMTGKAIAAEDSGLHASFELSDDGENIFLSSKKMEPVDSVEVPKLRYDTTWARSSDGSEDFERKSATPGFSNNGAEGVIYPFLAEPEFSFESGFYDEEFDLEIASGEGEVHYTLDGSIPSIDSPIYRGKLHIGDASVADNLYSVLTDVSVDLFDYINYKYAIPKDNVDKCTVVRAAVFDDRGNMSPTVTKSYFVGFDKKDEYDGLGIISLVSSPDGLFGDEEGIYVIGKKGKDDFKKQISESANALRYLEEHPDTPLDGSVSICGVRMDEFTDSNYWQSGTAWEREASFAVFDKDHQLKDTQDIGIRVKGHRTRNFPKKSINLYARSMYGDGDFRVRFFEKGEDSRLSLFAGGQDGLTIVRDRLIADLTNELKFTSLDFTSPYAVFLDGEFWGIYRISEKLDCDFIEKKFGVDDENVMIAKNKMLSKGQPGDEEIYGDFKNFIMHADFSLESDYEKFKERADVDSLIDYYASRIYIDEGMDWPNINTALWRSRDTGPDTYMDGRWRWLNFDNNANLDYGAVSVNTISKALNGTKNYKRDEMFYKLMQNEEFKKAFYDRFVYIATQVFDQKKTIEKLDALANEIRPYIELEYKRYYGERYSIESFDTEIEDMRKFFRERSSYIIPYVREACK